MNKEDLKEIYEIFKLVEQHKIKLPLLALDKPIFGILKVNSFYIYST